jgi:hypothetical protein
MENGFCVFNYRPPDEGLVHIEQPGPNAGYSLHIPVGGLVGAEGYEVNETF